MAYNLFKMWGSWIGALIGALIPFNCFMFAGCGNFGKPNILLLFDGSSVALLGLAQIIGGFLIGFGIHSLFRRLKR